MSKKKQAQGLVEFMEELAQRQVGEANKAVMDNIRARVEREHAERTEALIMRVYGQLEQQAETLRAIRRREREVQKSMADLRDLAVRVLTGKATDQELAQLQDKNLNWPATLTQMLTSPGKVSDQDLLGMHRLCHRR